EEVLTDRYFLKRLMPQLGDLPSDDGVLTRVEHAAERVAWHRAFAGAPPGEDHPGVEPPREREADALVGLAIPRQIGREHPAQPPVVLVRRKGLERFPFAWIEIAPFHLHPAVPAEPGRSAREHLDAFEQGAILEYTAAGNELGEASSVQSSQLRTDLENGLRLRREVQRVRVFVVVQPVLAVSVVEEDRRALPPVDGHTVKPAVQ